MSPRSNPLTVLKLEMKEALDQSFLTVEERISCFENLIKAVNAPFGKIYIFANKIF